MTSFDGSAQISKIGAGFAFSTPVDFNYGETVGRQEILALL